MAKWSDLPLELKEMVVDAVAVQASEWREDRVPCRERTDLIGPLVRLERATSERAASHLLRVSAMVTHAGHSCSPSRRLYRT